MKIEKNIPMPESASTRGKYKDILRQMEISDSVVVTFNGQAGMRQAAKVLGYKIVARKLGKRSEYSSQFRVWRVK